MNRKIFTHLFFLLLFLREYKPVFHLKEFDFKVLSSFKGMCGCACAYLSVLSVCIYILKYIRHYEVL